MIEPPSRAQTSARRQEILARVRAIAATLLDIDAADVDVERNFLELGADSLTLMDASRAFQDSFGVPLSIRLLLEEISNFANLAAYIDQALPPAAPVPVATTAPIPAPAPVVVTAPVPPSLPAVAAQSVPTLTVQPVPAPAVQPIPVVAVQPPPVFQPAPLDTTEAGATVVERVIAQQFQFLAHQLDQQRQILGQQLAALNGGHAAPVAAVSAPLPISAQPVPPPSAPATEIDTVKARASEPIRSEPFAPTPMPPPASSEQPTGAAEPFVPYRPITPGSASGLTARQQAHLDALVQRYTRRTAKSKEYAQRYRSVFAENRASAGFQMATKEMLYPIVAERSQGSRFWDVDGNEYIDLAMGFGVFLFGHSPAFIEQALASQLKKGFQVGPQSDLAGQVAERIAELTGLERVAFCNTGTEAVMVALRLARTATGRSKIAVFSGAFHGSYDVTLVRSRKVNGEDRAVPVAPGIPRSMADDVLVVDYDKPESLDIIRSHGHELAAVLVEPVQSRRPELQPKAFLQELRTITAETGTALIFDEVITGFRSHPRGAQGLFGVQADLALYGKVLAGGMPIGIVAGAARFMNAYDGGSWQYGDGSYPRALTSFFAGTFSKHPLTMAATWAVLEELTRQSPLLQQRLNEQTARLVQTLNEFFTAEELPIRMAHFGSLFRFSSSATIDLLFYHLAEKGIYVWEGRTCFLSTAHTDADVDAVIAAVQQSALELRSGGFLSEATRKTSNSLPQRSNTKQMAFSFYYFGKYASAYSDSKYDLLFAGARFADAHGFEAIWLPERHFHEFGGLSPNPSVLAAALARETTRIHLRAGSVVLPLHHPMRVAEEWSVVDNISKGRIAISFASGWHSNDFVFAPDAYGKHRELMFQQIDTVRRLWRGEMFEGPGGGGTPVRVKLFPMPRQKELPIWVTIVNNPDTYARAGALGAGILTNLMEQTLDDLEKNLAIYRSAREQHGFDPETGRVTVLLHTYMGDDLDAVRQKAEAPFCAYLKSFLGLTRSWVKNQGFAVDLDHLSEADLDYLLATSYKRYVQSTALIGTPASCAPIVERLASIGVNETACFVDFGVDREAVVQSFTHLHALKQLFDRPAVSVAPQRAAVVAASGSDGAQSGAADRSPVRTIPLTEGQQGFWLFSQLSAEASSASAESMVLRLKGPFQLEAMRTAIQQVVDRHEALRTTMDSGGEVQYVWPTRPIDLTVVDFSDRPEAAREQAVFQWLTDQKEPAFDLVRGPLWRCYVLNVSEHDHLLVLTIHHLVVDGWSLWVIGQELTVLYPAACRGVAANLPTPMQYHEYVQWEERERTTPARAVSEAYWKRQYADTVPLVDLPADRPRPGVATYRGAREHRRVDDDLYGALKKLGNQHGATLFMTMLASFTIFLERITGQDDLVIGSPSVRRSLPGSEGLVGFSLNMLAIRIKLAGDPTFPQHLAHVRSVLFDSYEHGDCPINVTARNLNLARDPSRPVFATVQFNLNPRIVMPSMGDLTVDLVPRPISFTPFDLFLDVMEINGELRLDFLYNTGLFDPATMQRWMDELITLMRSICEAPDRPISKFDLLPASERRLICEDWNRTAADYTRDVCVHELVEAQAERTPDRTAVVCESQQLSYRDLNQRANQVAHHLQKLGVGPETLVGVCLERSLDLLVSVLGVMKAGGAYVPLDPAYPHERLAFMVQDARVAAVLTQHRLRDHLPEEPTLICLDEDARLPRRSTKNPKRTTTPQRLAYVIYTSGSTGTPKGVQIRHQAVVNFLSSMRRAIPLTSDDRLLAVTSLSFDISVLELFLPLIAGAQVVVASRAEASDGTALLKRLLDSGATAMQGTPATWRLLLEAGWQADWPGRNRFRILCGGEAFARDLANPLLERAASVWNLYGPTETTIWSTLRQIDAGQGPLSIGRPIENTRAYIVDRSLEPVPIGIPGELLLGGDGLARDYLNRPELSAEKFVPDPFTRERGARLYRTGDLARSWRDGSIEFLGRIDQQVKVRGLRVELGEIEAVLASHPAVRQAAVVARDYGPNDKHLDAYVVARPRQAPTGDELRAHAKRKLPEYMMPSTVTVLDRLPLTANGKVDRRALPHAERDRRDETHVFLAPSTPMEQVMAAMWTEILGVKTIGIHDNFFDLGGHSLQGTQVVARLRDLFAIDLTLTSLFQAPTIAAMAALVSDRQRARRAGSGPDSAPVSVTTIPPRTESGALPLSYAQQRLWFLNRLEPESTAYHLANALRLQGPLNVDALERSLREIVRRHESLRTLFVSHDGRPVQIINPDSSFALVRRDLTDQQGVAQDAAVQQIVTEDTRRPFDLARGPLLRVSLLQLNEQDHVLILTTHHIVSDGWSNAVFARELAVIYESFSTGKPSPLPPLSIQYADYAEWQRQWLQGDVRATQVAYWKQQLAGVPAALELPTDRPRPAMKQYRGAYHPFVVPRGLADALHAVGRQADATPFMTLLAAFQTLLHRHTGHDDIAVGSPIANRHRTETEGLIGLFINTLVLRTNLAGNPSFRELLGRVRVTAIEAYAHQDLPFELLVDAVQPERSLSHSPLFQVMFVLQNNPPAVMKLAGITISQVAIDRATSKFDLTLSLEEDAQGFSGGFQYDTDLFDASTIARLADRFLKVLSAVAANPDQPIATIAILTDGERQRLAEWNESSAAYPHTPVHEMFEAQVERTPQATAVVCEHRALDYRELNRRANQLAHRLVALGVGCETLVGLYLERSIESMVGILGILKAGGAYVPIDPTYPATRVAFLLEDAGIAVLLTQHHLADDLPAHAATLLCLDPAWEDYARQPETNPAVIVEPASLAYLIYTSGSTGRPKAVAVEHRQLTNYVHGIIERLGLPSGANYATVSTFAADLGHTMIFPALVQGGTLHVLSQTRAAHPERFAKYMRSRSIDCLKIVPSHLAMLLNDRSSDDQILPRLCLVLGGEASQVTWVEQLHEHAGDCAIFNHYGPTETTVGVLAGRVERGTTGGAGQTLPLGRPLANSQIYILDRVLQRVPIGVGGEIYIGGAGLARGYFNRPDLTADRFVPNPFSTGSERLYRTGDLGRYLPDGSVEFLGRADQQVKVRGYRVELEEIEAVLATHPGVGQAAVIAWRPDDAGGVTRLVAYLVAASDAPPTVDGLRQFVKEKLPDYMMPASFVFLPALPLTSNGKLDRRALPEPDRDRPQLDQVFVAPSTPVEHVLAGIWSEVLNIDRVGIHDNFFNLGGHSLMATQVMARVFKVFQVEVPLRRLFEAPTVAGLRDALVEIPGERENIDQTAQLLMQLSELSEEQLESQLAERLAGA